MAEAAHSKFSASAAHRWMACPGSMVLSAGLPDKPSSYAAWGTVAHGIADAALREGRTADDNLGQVHEQDGFKIEVDQEMVDCVNTYLRNVREMTQGADLMLSETKVNYATYLGVPTEQAWGTADAISILGDELQVHDLKTGRGVEVDAEDNEQMKLYGLGALNAYENVADLTTVRLVIHQPRIKQAPSEWTISVEDLKAWGRSTARSAASSVVAAETVPRDHAEWESTFLRPGEDQCRFCKAKATCPALRDAVVNTIAGAPVSPTTPGEFLEELSMVSTKLGVDSDDTATWLSAAMAKADLIEDWLKAVRAEVERRLLAGQAVPGYKLVQGKQGNRAWADKAQAEELLRKVFRLPIEKAYDLTLISPTTAEKLAKAGDIGERQWKKAEALITRAPGKPSVAPLSDKREALVVGPVADEFQPVGDAADFV